jgi:4-amino-4-deoxy-L-arabinose transferase-like glycosyltransferase
VYLPSLLSAQLKPIKTIQMNKKLVIAVVILSFLLRIVFLKVSPPGLYWDETALGYDAFSLLKTGHDHRGNGWPFLWIESYIDFKPPLYVYLLIPFISLFGLNVYTVRLLSVIAGVLIVFGVFKLVKIIFKNKKIALFSALVAMVNPALIMFSRAGFEVNVAVCLYLWAIIFWLQGKKPIFKLISVVFFGLTLYTYHGAKIIAPLTAGALFLHDFPKLKQNIKKYLALGLVFLIFLAPHLYFLGSKQTSQRFQETSAFTTLDPIIESNQEISKDNNNLLSRIVHHRYVKYAGIFTAKYISHFAWDFVFLTGDDNPRHSLDLFGIMYHLEIVSLLTGLVYVIKKKKYILFIPILLVPVAASLTKATPHALRTLFMVPFLTLLSGIGLSRVFAWAKKQAWPTIYQGALIAVIFGQVLFFGAYYFNAYPLLHSQSWQYAYQPLFDYIGQVKDKYKGVYIDNSYGRAYMYYLFYLKIDPEIVQQIPENERKKPDIVKINNFYFASKPDSMNGILQIETSQPAGRKPVKTINFLDSSPAFYIYEN